MKTPDRRRLLKAVAVGAAAGLIGGLFALSPAGAALERNLGLSWLFGWRGAIAPPDEVAIVAIDSRTGEQSGLPPLPRDWSRSTHARVLDALVRAGATAVAFDMQFDRPRDTAGDAAFADAVRRADRVALIQLATGRRQPVQGPDGRPAGTVWVESLVEPIEPLRDSARALATFPLPKIDATVVEFWAFKESVGDAPTLPAAMLQLHALDRWPQWQARLAALEAPELGGLPTTAAELGRAESFGGWMVRQRQLLASLPEAAAALGAASSDSSPTSTSAPDPLRALAAMYAGDPHRTLNFYGPPGTIATIPYQQVLSGESRFDFRGKAVFVGFSDLYDPGQPDRFYTVYTRPDGVDLSGVEIAATAFANLLTGRTITPLDLGPTFAGLLLFGALTGALVYYLPALLGVPLALALATAWALLAAQLFAVQQLWLPLATPLLVQLPLALFLGLIAQYLLERRRRLQASAALGYYLPESVARGLTEGSLDREACNRVVHGICLSTDMSGFSTISEKLPPGELAQFLNTYFDVLARALRRHGVDVTEFRADAIMCAWIAEAGDPLARRRAVAAAIDAVEAIERFREAYPQLTASLRVGLEAGNFYLGHAGGGGHFVFSIVGDTANTASRLESLNKHLGTCVLAGGSAVAGLDGLLLRPLGRFRLMGKRDDTAIVEVLAPADQASAGQQALCADFAEALALYRDADDFQTALASFEALRARYPQDGPTRFYLDKCRACLASGQVPPVPRALVMDSK